MIYFLCASGGATAGFMLCAWLTDGKLADKEAERVAAFKAGKMVGRVMGAIRHEIEPPMDDGSRLLHVISDAYLYAERQS